MEKSKKNFGVLGATLAIGMGLGAITNEITAATTPILKPVKTVHWLDAKKASTFENIVTVNICKGLMAEGAKKCDLKTIKEQDINIQWIDSNRDGKPDAWRVESNGKIPGDFVGK